jgi:predicted kinase
MERLERCEHRICSTASEIVQRGGSVILDLGFMKISDRARFISLTEAKGLPLQMHFVTAPHGLRRNRVIARNTNKGETFSFGVPPSMFDFMEKEFEQPTDDELSKSIVFSSQ